MNGETIGIGWLALGFLLAILALAGAVGSRRRRATAGLRDGTVIYADTGTWIRQQEALYSPDLRLVGKPDYLVEEAGGMILPVELKSGRAGARPHQGHVLQLAAYCLLVDDLFGRRPAYGILQYRDRAFAIDYTIELEEEVLDLLVEMRESLFEGELDRDHNDWGRCARCGLREHCYQRLA
jgi:CRISPR-associated exonuclease Cas4